MSEKLKSPDGTSRIGIGSVIPSLPPRVVFWAKVVLAALILGLLVRMAGLSTVINALSGARPSWLALMYLLMFAVLGYQSAVMQAILKQAGLVVRVSRVILAHTLARLYSLITPGELVASAAKWKSLTDATGSGAIVLNSIVYYRFVLLLGPLVVGSMALLRANPFPRVPLGELAALLAIFMVLSMGFFLSRRTAPVCDRAVGYLLARLPGVIRGPGRKVLLALDALRAMTIRQHLSFGVAGMFEFFLVLVSFWSATQALNLDLPLTTVIWVQAALLVLRLLPITFANLGIREGLLVVVLGIYDVLPGDAVALGLLLFSQYLVIAGIGAFYQIYLLWAQRDEVSATRES